MTKICLFILFFYPTAKFCFRSTESEANFRQ